MSKKLTTNQTNMAEVALTLTIIFLVALFGIMLGIARQRQEIGRSECSIVHSKSLMRAMEKSHKVIDGRCMVAVDDVNEEFKQRMEALPKPYWVNPPDVERIGRICNENQ